MVTPWNVPLHGVVTAGFRSVCDAQVAVHGSEQSMHITVIELQVLTTQLWPSHVVLVAALTVDVR
jgi:hypothetical protein